MASWIKDKPVAQAATYTTHNKHIRRKSKPSASFEHAVPAIKRLLTYDLDPAATGIGTCVYGNDVIKTNNCTDGYRYIL